MIITLIDKIRNRQSENSLTRRKGSRRMGEENKQPFADIETNQQMTVGKINLAPYPAKNFCEWLQEQAKVQRSRKDS